MHLHHLLLVSLAPQQVNQVLGTAHNTWVGRLEEARAEPYSIQYMRGVDRLSLHDADVSTLCPKRSKRF
jgi:hypothetical protein